MYNVLAEAVTFVSKYVHSRRLLKWHTNSAILSKSCFPTQTQRHISIDDLLVVWNNGELQTLCHYQGLSVWVDVFTHVWVDTCANRTSWWGVSWPGLPRIITELYKKARFARVRARPRCARTYAGVLPDSWCPTLSAPPIGPALSPDSSRWSPFIVCMYVCMYVLQGNCSLLFRLGQTKCAVIITTYIVLVSFRPGQKSTCFSVINTLDLQS